MGMYTEFIFGAELKSDTPEEVIDALRYMIGHDVPKPEKEPYDGAFSYNNPIGEARSYYFPVHEAVSRMWLYKDEVDYEGDHWIISTRSNRRGGHGSAEMFIEWIRPYVHMGSGINDMIGISIYEEDLRPTIYYLDPKDT